jgi:hypothetical protein
MSVIQLSDHRPEPAVENPACLVCGLEPVEYRVRLRTATGGEVVEDVCDGCQPKPGVGDVVTVTKWEAPECA